MIKRSVSGIMFIALGLVLTFSFAPASKQFEGSLTYSITYLEVPDGIKGMESMLPPELTMYFKDSKIALEQELMGGSQRVILDNKDSTSFVLMDMMGQKICVVLSKEELREAAKDASKPSVSYYNDTKKILNYSCKKAIITQGDNTTTVFYTDKLNIVKHKDFDYLDGFPLEYESFNDGMKLRMTCKSISEKELSDAMFTVPAGYTKMTTDELEGMVGE